jgi:hypothetical protein
MKHLRRGTRIVALVIGITWLITGILWLEPLAFVVLTVGEI